MKLSLITVCYNSEETIQKTFDSIRSQTYENIEYIVVDGNSNDSTVNIIKNNQDIISKWVSEPDKGLYEAMNKGIKLASGDVVGILNSDDFYKDEYILSNIISCFKREQSDIVYGNIDYVDASNLNKIVRTWKSSKYQKGRFKRGWHPPHPSLFVKRNIYNKFGLFDTNYKVAADFDLMLRFFEKEELKCFYLDKTIVSMRQGGISNDLKGRLKGKQEIKNSFLKNNLKRHFAYNLFRYLPKIKSILIK